MKGCSSLGRLRFAVLLGVGKSRTKEGGLWSAPLGVDIGTGLD
jgi:hypothetical protein